MKTRCIKLISVFLSLLLVFAVIPAAAFADSTVPHYDTYTALGDSNPAGYGLDSYFANAGGLDIKEGDRIAGSYPDLVATAVGATKFNSCGHSGWRTNEFLRVMDPTFDYNDGFSNMYYTALHFEDRSASDAFAATIKPSIEESDLITVQLGSNDIFTHSINRTTDQFPDLLDDLAIEVPESIDENTLFNLIIEAADKAGILVDVVAAFINNMNENIQSFKNNIPRVINIIRENNPTAPIYVVGVINAINMAYVTENETFLSLISTIDLRLADVNYYLKTMCGKMDNCYYVDVPNTEMFGIGVLDFEKLFALDEDVKYSAVKIVHATERGHAYMADQIINAIKDNAVSAPVVSVSKSTLLKKNIVKWDNLEDAAMYRVYRSTSENGEYSYIGSTRLNVFYDGISLSRTTYYYKVCAVMNYSSGILSPMSTAAHA